MFSTRNIYILIFTLIIIIKLETVQSSEKSTNGTVTWEFGTFIKVPNDSIKFSLYFFAPTNPGPKQVVIFFSGLDGIAPSFAYTDYCSRLAAESNSIIIVLSKLSTIHLPSKEETLFEQTLNWTLSNIDGLMNMNSTPSVIRGRVTVDLKTYGVSLMAHSAGGHIVCMYLVKECGLVRSLILMDPVDGYDPFGIVKDYVTHPPNKLPFQIPTLIATTRLSSVGVNSFIVPCAPANFSNLRFYDSLNGPTWYLNFTNYGHADVLDDWIRMCCSSLICKPCEKNCDFKSYRKNLASAVSYFLRAVNEKNQVYLNAIRYPMKSGMFDTNMNIEAFFDEHGFNITQTGPFCNHS